jgi:acyl-[acyl-carrier-protein]-phospholipid O-acyltransferase/long-chain-fatty-acid--[acyl-carrier-protein] ligase
VLSSFLHLTPLHIFLVSSLLTVIATIYVCWLQPDSLMRLVLWLLTHSVYRIRVVGRENIPERSGALFVSNHMSFVDALLVIASTDRRIRFLMEEELYELPLAKPFFPNDARHPDLDAAKSSGFDPRLARSHAQHSGRARGLHLRRRQITRIGQLLPFRKGFERIMKNVDAPIIPVNLDRVWGSMFSYNKGKIIWKMPRLSFQPITVSFGKPMPGSPRRRRSARQFRSWRQMRMCIANPTSRSSNAPSSVVCGSILSALQLQMDSIPKSAISDCSFAVFFWLGSYDHAGGNRRWWGSCSRLRSLVRLRTLLSMLAGKIPVNLNYTVSQPVLDSCIAQCQIETILTSVSFWKR